MFNGVYSNVTGVPQSLSGSKSYLADTVHFSSQDCNITCDGPALTVCCPVEFKDGLVIDELCVDGEFGCDKLVVQNGATNGIAFSDDPCASPVVSVPAMYTGASGLNVVAPSGNVDILAPNSVSTTATTGATTINSKTSLVSYSRDSWELRRTNEDNGVTQFLTTQTTAGFRSQQYNAGQTQRGDPAPLGGQTMLFYPLNWNTPANPTVDFKLGWQMNNQIIAISGGGTDIPGGGGAHTNITLDTANYLEPSMVNANNSSPFIGGNITPGSTQFNVGRTTNRIHRVSTERLNLNLYNGTSSGQPKSPVGEAGDKQGDMVLGGISGSTFNLFVCVADYDSTSNIWVKSSAFGAWSY